MVEFIQRILEGIAYYSPFIIMFVITSMIVGPLLLAQFFGFLSKIIKN